MSCCGVTDVGQRYPARISAVAGSTDSPTFTITFKGYSTSTTVPHSSLRPHDPFAPIPVPVTTKRKTPEEIKREERENEKKRKKGERWAETQNEREKDVKGKMSAWQNFGKKAQKKGINISGCVQAGVFIDEN
jgi:survival-of-motor-neuron-related-splicing factor 30